MNPIVYLDHSATTKVLDEVLEAMRPFQADWWGNPSSIHDLGRRSRAAVDRARHQVAALVGAQPSDFCITLDHVVPANTPRETFLDHSRRLKSF